MMTVVSSRNLPGIGIDRLAVRRDGLGKFHYVSRLHRADEPQQRLTRHAATWGTMTQGTRIFEHLALLLGLEERQVVAKLSLKRKFSTVRGPKPGGA